MTVGNVSNNSTCQTQGCGCCGSGTDSKSMDLEASIDKMVELMNESLKKDTAEEKEVQETVEQLAKDVLQNTQGKSEELAVPNSAITA